MSETVFVVAEDFGIYEGYSKPMAVFTTKSAAVAYAVERGMSPHWGDWVFELPVESAPLPQEPVE